MKHEYSGTEKISQLRVYFMCLAGEVHKVRLLETYLLTDLLT